MMNTVKGLRIVYIDIDSIRVNSDQPRRNFDGRELLMLSRSIKNYGMLQPVTVRKKDGIYELVAGERRVRAARMAGYNKIPAIVRNMKEEAAATYAIMENTHRSPITYLEEAEGYSKIIQRHGFTKKEFSAKTGIDREALEKKLILTTLKEEVKDRLLKYNISEKTAYEISKAGSAELQLEMMDIIHKKGYDEERAIKYAKEVLYDAAHKEETLRKQMVKNAMVYVNTIKRTVDMMKKAGLSADTEKKENEEFIEYIIKIAK